MNKLKKNDKVLIIVLSMASLVGVGVIGWDLIDENNQYSMSELVTKYPTITDLKDAVDAGQIDYDKLPELAKKFLDDYEPFEEIKNDDPEFIEGLK